MYFTLPPYTSMTPLKSLVLLFLFTGLCSGKFTCTTLTRDIYECNQKNIRDVLPQISEMLKGKTDFIAPAVLLPYWRDMCQYQSQVKSYFTCALSAIRDCTEGNFRDSFPVATNFNEGFEFVCNNIDAVEEGCYQVEQSAIHQCAFDASGTPPVADVDDTQDFVDYNCRLFSNEVKCTQQSLNNCLETKKIVTSYLDYLARPACGAVNIRFSVAMSAVLFLATWFISKQ